MVDKSYRWVYDSRDMKKEEKELLRLAASILGSRTSAKKSKASRENGKLGGRPRKKQDEKSL
jgi:hypothetical protein